MADHHSGNRNGKTVGAIQRISRGVTEQRRLNAELNRSAECRRVDSEIGARSEPGGLMTIILPRELPVQQAGDAFHDGISHERHHKGHVEAVGPEGQNAAVAEQKSLQQQRG